MLDYSFNGQEMLDKKLHKQVWGGKEISFYSVPGDPNQAKEWLKIIANVENPTNAAHHNAVV